MKFLKQLFCKHDYEFVTNDYSYRSVNDLTMKHKSYFSVWKCKKCGKYKYDEFLEWLGE